MIFDLQQPPARLCAPQIELDTTLCVISTYVWVLHLYYCLPQWHVHMHVHACHELHP